MSSSSGTDVEPNTLFWKIVKRILDQNISPMINPLRRRNGLADIQDLISGVWVSRELNLIAVSREICARRSDWKDIHQVCGFFSAADVGNEGAVSQEIERFLEQGSPPIFMTFGSMLLDDIGEQTEVAQLFAGAAQIAGCKAIIQAPQWEACNLSSSDNICYVRAVPHARMFPQCLAVVYHGGAGTVHIAMFAGIPSIVVPHISDQFFWGHALKRIGIAPEILPRNKVTQETLAERIKAVQGSPAMQARARDVGQSMRNEDGVAKAVQLIN